MQNPAMKIFILPAMMAIFCARYLKQPQTSSSSVKSAPSPTAYENVKTHITQLRAQLKYTNVHDTTILQNCFVHVIADSLIPYWYGTAWDFNGTTQVPGKGSIACGYFVSTVLRDAGLKINRVKMGRCSSETFTYALAERKDIKIFYDKPLNDMISYIQNKGFGLYIIGLDSHVGFLLNDGKTVWFIHSKWFAEQSVVKEVAVTASVLYYSKYRMVGKISNNKKLLEEWVGYSN